MATGAAAPAEFDRAVAVRRLDERSFAASGTADWGAAGHPQGGYLAAQILLAMGQTVREPDRTPRSLTVTFLRSPAFGDYTVECDVERAGRSVTHLSGRLVQDGVLMGIALAVFAADRTGPDWDELPMPAVDPPTPTRASEYAIDPLVRRIAQRLVLQQRIGRPLFSGHGPMEIGGWMGFTDPRPIDAAGLCVLGDAMLVPLAVRMSGNLMATATLDYTVHFRAPLPRSYPHELVLGRFTTGLVRGGFADWDGVVWGPDGTLLCQCRQQLVLFPG